MREGGTECHDPYGSIQSKLLVQGENHLCLKCHAQVQFGSPSDMLIGKVPHGQMIQAGVVGVRAAYLKCMDPWSILR